MCTSVMEIPGLPVEGRYRHLASFGQVLDRQSHLLSDQESLLRQRAKVGGGCKERGRGRVATHLLPGRDREFA
jgi:hypothetical protein